MKIENPLFPKHMLDQTDFTEEQWTQIGKLSYSLFNKVKDTDLRADMTVVALADTAANGIACATLHCSGGFDDTKDFGEFFKACFDRALIHHYATLKGKK